MRSKNTRFVCITEDMKIIENIDSQALIQGMDRSAWIRGAIRDKLKREETSDV